MNLGKLTLSGRGAWRCVCTLALFCTMAGMALQAQTFNTIFNFDETNGNGPTTPVQGFDGKLYGTTITGGACVFGTVYKTTLSGNLVPIYSFCENSINGAEPGPLVLGQNGSFYGVTENGGTSNTSEGTIFRITGGGTLTTLYDFGLVPDSPLFANSALVQVPNGSFYGASLYGSTNCEDTGCGTIFKIAPSGALTTLYNFCAVTKCLDGAYVNTLILGASGSLYGTTLGGGTADAGTVFEITQAGVLTTLYSFCSLTNCADGDGPGALIQGADGNFYGTTGGGGAGVAGNNIGGTVFKLTPQGKRTTLYFFCS